MKKSTNKNMYEASVKQFNPFKGCKYDCVYCLTSFQKQAKRQKHLCMKCYNYTPHTHPERLNNYLPKTKEGEFVFTFASGDVSFCPTGFLEKVIKRIGDNPEKTFLIQSKNPKTFERVKFSENVILGITLETNKDDIYGDISKAPKSSQRYKDFCKIDHPRKMVTIEPVIEFDFEILDRWVKEIDPFLVWLGYDSKKGSLPEPGKTKVLKLKESLEDFGIQVKLKTIREAR